MFLWGFTPLRSEVLCMLVFTSRNAFASHLPLSSRLLCLESVVIKLVLSCSASSDPPALLFLVKYRSSALSLSHRVWRREVVQINFCKQLGPGFWRASGLSGMYKAKKGNICLSLFFSQQYSKWCKYLYSVDSLQLFIKVKELLLISCTWWELHNNNKKGGMPSILNHVTEGSHLGFYFYTALVGVQFEVQTG